MADEYGIKVTVNDESFGQNKLMKLLNRSITFCYTPIFALCEKNSPKPLILEFILGIII